VSEYYLHKLSALRLKRVYEVAPPRVRQYLEAEVNHVLEKIHSSDLVVELGCGYGRILPKLAHKAGWVIGIDTSVPSLKFALQTLDGIRNYSLSQMDAGKLGFRDGAFDCVACIQNEISAFHINKRTLINECVRVTRAGGIVLLSSYSDKFWEERLKWFELQSKDGLLGAIDYNRTKKGTIVCRDGFTATTLDAEGFQALTASLKAHVRVVEVDESSLFCEIEPLSD